MVSKLEVSETWFKRVWNDEDEKAIFEMFIPKGDAHGLVSKKVIGPDQFVVFHRLLLKQFSNVSVEIKQHIEDEEWIALRVVISAVAKATGDNVDMSGQIMLLVVDDKIQEAHNSLDFSAFFEQAGLLPTGVMERCLNGEKLT